ncbi:response regulator [Pelovirga terrestris]|uniref:Response regulator n=1 Tax=Pelovirga terrestris TaxID=2771352 RepID=A0A8J6QVS2_9BACT|nr:response regulator [Pelovirga terrestris]MBD1399201.1 response regulator [Pelovirga terrestris]
MKIQCPKCEAKYLTQLAIDSSSSVVVTCPKCRHRFTVDPLKDGKPSPKILIVDDARFFRELIMDLLVDQNVELTTAHCGEEAWKLLQSVSFDLLIADINLPDISGSDLIKRVRNDPHCASLPILCISGVYRQDDDARQAFIAGANDFMTKSFHPEDFTARIDKLLAR